MCDPGPRNQIDLPCVTKSIDQFFIAAVVVLFTFCIVATDLAQRALFTAVGSVFRPCSARLVYCGEERFQTLLSAPCLLRPRRLSALTEAMVKVSVVLKPNKHKQHGRFIQASRPPLRPNPYRQNEGFDVVSTCNCVARRKKGFDVYM